MKDLWDRHQPEKKQRLILEELFGSSKMSTFEMFRNFPVFTPRINLARFLTHYEIFKCIHELPGVIIDLGILRGGSTFTWAKLCEIFCPTDVKKSFTPSTPLLDSQKSVKRMAVKISQKTESGAATLQKSPP